MSSPLPLRAAVCQFAPSAQREDNRMRLTAQIEEAAALGARLVVFPEYSSYFVDPLDASLADAAEDLDGPFVRELTSAAAAGGVTVIAGLIESAGDGRVHNALVAVDGAGVQAVYRKQHLYDAFGQQESDWIEPGSTAAPETFEVAGLRIGMMTCYDLRFPEVARTLVDAGVDAIAVPAEWVRGPAKEHHWSALLAARAIENTVYVLAADHPVPTGIGHSQIIDPEGLVLAGAGTTAGIAFATLDKETIERVRRVNPALRLRRYRVLPR